MTNKNYEQLKKEIIKAVPDKELYNPKSCPLKYESITLEDILRVINKPYTIHNIIRDFSKILIICSDMRIKWHLNKDLDWHWENKKETVEFLYNLIYK